MSNLLNYCLQKTKMTDNPSKAVPFPRSMESPGKYLKTERESQNLTLKEVSESTKIREPLLKAIEEDKYEFLPPAYVKGFLNGYSKYLGLSPNDIILKYQKHLENKILSKGTESKQRITSSKLKLWITLLKKGVK